MEVMKKLIRKLLLLLFIFSTLACASTSEAGAYNEKKQSPKRLLFEDWKYKGFGKALPLWFEAAYNGDEEALRASVDELSDHQIKILTARGVNSDQADKALRLKLADISDFKLYDSCWALLGQKAALEDINEYPYFAAAVLYIE